ncbi:MAG: amino acid ABC transporter permease [Holosporaceae bacterium]|jgi:polar amino acid transport system permease protein|nr:amino acid ABC transporter permease [Holosporaceae bacterium]
MEKLFVYFLQIWHGVGFSLTLLAGGFFVGITLGTILAITRYTRFRFITNQVITLVRSTPLILQVSIIYFAIPGALGVHLNVLTAGIIAFGINSSAYVSEILRAGIESLPRGQFEAAQALGIPKYYTWRDIILPQVVSNVLPALVNEIIALLKETSIISVIGGTDIMRRAQITAAENFEYFTPLCIAGFCYYVLVVLIEFIGKQIAKRTCHYHAKN